MKEVTIDTVRERIAELEMVHGHGELSLRGEFEMACLRMLSASLEAEAVGEVVLGEYDDCGCYPDARVVCIAADGQADWENFKNGTRLYTAQPAPASVPDEMTPKQASRSYCGEVRGYRDGWNACRAAMLNQPQEPPADNTAQQFEALATSGKSEHLLNAERIAREANALSDRLNTTSAVHHRVSGWSERQQKVIAYSLWRFSCTAYQKANQAAQTNNKEMFDRFIRDARCAEEIREEFTSAWIVKP